MAEIFYFTPSPATHFTFDFNSNSQPNSTSYASLTNSSHSNPPVSLTLPLSPRLSLSQLSSAPPLPAASASASASASACHTANPFHCVRSGQEYKVKKSMKLPSNEPASMWTVQHNENSPAVTDNKSDSNSILSLESYTTPSMSSTPPLFKSSVSSSPSFSSSSSSSSLSSLKPTRGKRIAPDAVSLSTVSSSSTSSAMSSNATLEADNQTKRVRGNNITSESTRTSFRKRPLNSTSNSDVLQSSSSCSSSSSSTIDNLESSSAKRIRHATEASVNVKRNVRLWSETCNTQSNSEKNEEKSSDRIWQTDENAAKKMRKEEMESIDAQDSVSSRKRSRAVILSSSPSASSSSISSAIELPPSRRRLNDGSSSSSSGSCDTDRIRGSTFPIDNAFLGDLHRERQARTFIAGIGGEGPLSSWTNSDHRVSIAANSSTPAFSSPLADGSVDEGANANANAAPPYAFFHDLSSLHFTENTVDDQSKMDEENFSLASTSDSAAAACESRLPSSSYSLSSSLSSTSNSMCLESSSPCLHTQTRVREAWNTRFAIQTRPMLTEDDEKS